MQQTPISKSSGFTSIELLIVVIVAGMVGVLFFTMMTGVGKFGKVPDEKRLYDISYALSEHVRVKGVLPCPAQLNLPANHARFNQSDCNAAFSVPGRNGGKVLVGALPIDDLLIASDCITDYDSDKMLSDDEQGMLRNSFGYLKNKLFMKHHAGDVAAGATEQNAYQDFHKAAKEGCMSENFAFDDYGSKFIYAVSEKATQAGKFNPFDSSGGEIEILNAYGNRATQDLQFFVVVGLGPDKIGGTNAQGSGVACDLGTKGGENCDMDSIFVDRPYEEGDDGDYFDDTLEYSLANLNLTENSYWYWSGETNPNEKNVTFNPNARVLIDKAEGTDNATNNDKLVVNSGNIHVDGDITIDSNSAGSGAYAPKFCYEPALSSACQ